MDRSVCASATADGVSPMLSRIPLGPVEGSGLLLQRKGWFPIDCHHRLSSLDLTNPASPGRSGRERWHSGSAWRPGWRLCPRAWLSGLLRDETAACGNSGLPHEVPGDRHFFSDTRGIVSAGSRADLLCAPDARNRQRGERNARHHNQSLHLGLYSANKRGIGLTASGPNRNTASSPSAIPPCQVARKPQSLKLHRASRRVFVFQHVAIKVVTSTSLSSCQCRLTWSLSAVSHASSPGDFTSATPRSGTWPSRGRLCSRPGRQGHCCAPPPTDPSMCD